MYKCGTLQSKVCNMELEIKKLPPTRILKGILYYEIVTKLVAMK